MISAQMVFDELTFKVIADAVQIIIDAGFIAEIEGDPYYRCKYCSGRGLIINRFDHDEDCPYQKLMMVWEKHKR